MIKASTIILLLAFVGTIGFAQVGGTDQLRDSLKHKLAIAKDDTSRVLIMVDIANAYYVNSSDSISKYGNQALALAQRIRFSRGEASALTALGVCLQTEGDYPKSLEYVYKGLHIAEKKNYVFETAVCYAWIGGAYWFLADYSKAVDFYNKSQHLFETIINRPRVRDWMLLNILDIGQSYLDWNRLDSAYRYLSEHYKATLHDVFWHPVALYSLGDCLFKQGNRDTAFDFLRESIAGAAINDDYFTQAEAYAVISRFFKTTQQPDFSIYYAKKGLTAANAMAYEFGVYKNSKLLAEEYEQLNVQEALHYRKVFDSVNESMYGAKKVQDLQKTLAEEQQRQQQIQEEQIEKESRLKQYEFITGLGIMILIAFILYKNNLQKKQANVLLQHQKEKLESTLQELKSTQAQLIQSEKMASLGELTAGIAHEIQNPLNFVNNFSEVNTELIEELKSQKSKVTSERDEELEFDLLNDIKENEQKINYHGKRADAIVKGMLQHSRTITGQKEPTDINALADEYLRLSYHGFRAKDKSFNATIETHFDESIGKIEVVPQDVGRILLNLFNNAFYAVNEKKKQLNGTFEPLVLVTTKRSGEEVQIRVRDNGTGIPQKVVDKIFQPFFTTKPTGQGTGLGLSLSYDIIKALGGELSVQTQEHDFSAFTVSLPIR
ncbi:tetratricopeptide repeat-containing sensor histidine kinase [Segetibacter koreensis]|uniref:tetratricopeptide repeat-containing sensor histidine kinase n=2 Tax=Segetibacter koreensis TaxID=398037 RepID=UPI00035DACDD|nr:ATP-binding protein [Segetibacter koreensis]